ncbi:ribose-phosphate diphosphokinase [Sphingobium sp.]|uniref:ribose-phosphate diphosphokinase n=1 Tax=Sphingobium sp. TaxID=1912891 RepID=UPI0035C66C2F
MSTILFGFGDSVAATRRLGRALNVPALEVEVHRFPDGECLVRIPSTARTVLFYRSLNDPDHKIIELLFAASAARDGGAERVILIAPYFCYMRQDMAFRSGEAVSQKVIGSLVASHFDGLITVDPHLHRVASLNEVVRGITAISVSAAPLLATLIDDRDAPVIVGPDGESRQWIEAIAAPLALETLVASKRRLGDRHVGLAIAGADRVKGRRAIVVDDMISSGRTLVEAARLLHDAGCLSVEAVVTHCLAGPHDLAWMAASGIASIASSDSVDGSTNRAELAPLICRALRENELA